MPVRLCYVAVYTAKFYSYLCIRVDRVVSAGDVVVSRLRHTNA